jgi:26S proteasome regulatory subunit N2
VPRVVALLAESYNPHVRYGAALAVGIACAGGQRARNEAFATIEPLLKDRVDYVRQGAYLAFAMICMQHNEKSEPKLAVLRKAIDNVMNVKSDTMTKLGAIIAAGIVDAGGRNTTISLLSSTGHKRMQAIVGMAMFPQFWYWYPLVHFLSLSFTPTAIIGLNKNLEIPEPFTFISNAPPSTFAYPPAIQLTKVEEKKTVKHATLSVTAKAKAKAKKKEEEKESSMEVENSSEKKSESSAMDVEPKDESAESKAISESHKTTAEPEPSAQELRNPARVTLSQQSVISYSSEQRYVPVKKSLTIGAILLRDTTPGEPEVMVQKKEPKIGVPGVSDDEPQPPQPFEYRS